MKLTRTTPPTQLPIGLDDVKRRLDNYTGTDIDQQITEQIRVASEYLEAICWRTFMTTTWTAKWDSFRRCVFLPRPPLISVTSVYYINSSGVSTEVTSAEYTIKSQGDLSYLIPLYGTSWPSPRGEADAVTIVYTAGYGANRRDVPLGIRDAIAIVAAARVRATWTGCEDVALPRSVRHLLTDYDVKDESVLQCL